jgi:hypothetical protein
MTDLEAELAQLTEGRFPIIDRDHSARVRAAEIRRLLRILGPSLVEMEAEHQRKMKEAMEAKRDV